MKLFTPTALAAAITLATMATAPALAQQAPGAGLIYQQSQEQDISPQAPSVELDLQGAPLTESEQGGAKVRLNKVTVQGKTLFDSPTLLAQLGDFQGKEYDLAGLRSLANRISQFYRQQGYPFAQAFIPAQNMANGELIIQMQEGRYDHVDASGEPRLVDAARPYLANLQPGQVIESKSLERSMLILGDQPGVAVIPVMRPGERVGTGELDVQVSPDQRVAARLSTDNHGSRFSGEYRGRADVQINRALLVGDELSVSALYTNEETWLGSLTYSLPLSANGLRGFVGYSQTDYSLGKGFEGYTGTAKVSSVGASYPLLRSQQSNVRLQANYQYKDLDDNIGFADFSKATRSQSIPLSVSFDHRDALAGGGVSWGALTLTPGRIDIEQSMGDNLDYDFFKANLELARLQALTSSLSLYGRFSGQWADTESLDGSESFYLGGVNGVRAFPVGEGSDSRGWLAQLELRYDLGQGWVPYLLLDTGRTPNGGTDEGEDRAVSGMGAGVRYAGSHWHADLVSAWKVSGGDAQADGKQQDPRLWFNLGYRL
ncbi:hypothetical protein GCM10011502_27200 [Oceanisphaera marina]|uniref:Peptide ABC transporter permease n=1 Tax=Oceanisphaera marina TaxID=2017550 RepID=A0ABQ1IUT4_9GAMM|nr:ShlB/FhaC/HecB family hemolysin secretion/activation protein [Oceanisphaera marina]GGB52618.1 hypothetical protein GCM10011502_27200 [Oceanisphaera marina]